MKKIIKNTRYIYDEKSYGNSIKQNEEILK